MFNKAKWQRSARRMLGCILLTGWSAAAQAGWTALTNGEAGFNVPTAYANLRTLDFSTGGASTATTYNTLDTEQTAGKLSYTAPSTSWTQGDTTSLDGTSGKHIRVTTPGSTSSFSNLTINFPNGGTSYVAFLWGLSVANEHGEYVKFTFSDGSTQTLYNCTTASDATCVGNYVSSGWLGGLLSWLLGGNNYDTTYVTYTPATGISITKVQFYGAGCNCALLGLPTSEYFYVENFSYVDTTVPPHHLEVTTPSSTITAGSAATFTVKSCADAACTSLFTTGMTGTFSLTGTGMTPTYLSGQTYTIGARSSSTTITASITPSGTATVALSAPSRTPSGSPAVYCGIGVAAASGNSCNIAVIQPLHHVELTAPASTAITCTPLTYTVKACGDAACTALYTAGLSGTLTVSGTSVNYPSGQTFSIASGSATTTISAHATTTGTATAALSALSAAATGSPSVYCGMGALASSGGACGITMSSSALYISAPDHVSDTSPNITVSAVQSSNNATACTPAFASVSKNVTFKCSYTNPTSGTLSPSIGGSAINAANSTASACDATGRSVSLAFDANGTATAALRYADVGKITLTGTYTGSGSDAGLSMTGTDTFIAAPYYFSVDGITAGNLTAGGTFSATVTARNKSGTNTPNFGRETTPEGVTLSFVRAKPTGTGAVNGSFSGTAGSFSNGTASLSNLSWSEVGTGDVAVVLSSGNYLSSGVMASGSSAGDVMCASDGGTCTLPSGATAVVYYGANGKRTFRTGVSGSIACTSAVFGDPSSGGSNVCKYLVNAGAAPGATGAAGPFLPHHFDASLTQGCSGAFTYSGQPFSITVTARNAAGGATANYDGTANTSPNYAKAVTLSAITNGGTGALTGGSIAASSFGAGVATLATTPTFTFTSKLTSAKSVTIRAIDTDNVSSASGSEGSVAVRSGRIKTSNVFGSEKNSLISPVQAQYWNGKDWILNSADSCTAIPAASVVRTNYRDSKGNSTSAWATSVSAIAISGGNGNLTLGAPFPSNAGSVELAFNLGGSTTDQSCLSNHPASTGANLAWLRDRNGSANACAGVSTYDRDPSLKASFGIYQPETKKSVYVRDLH